MIRRAPCGCRGTSIQARSTAAESSLRLAITSRRRSILVTRLRRQLEDVAAVAAGAADAGAARSASSRGPVSSASCERRAGGSASGAARRRSAPARCPPARRAGRAGRRCAARKPAPAASASVPCSGGSGELQRFDGHGVAARRVEADRRSAPAGAASRSPPPAAAPRTRSPSAPGCSDAVDHHRDADPPHLAGQDHPLACGSRRPRSSAARGCRWPGACSGRRRRSTSPSGRLLATVTPEAAALAVLGALLGLRADRHAALGVDDALGDGLAVHVGIDVDLDDGAAGADARLEQPLDVGAQRLGAVVAGSARRRLARRVVGARQHDAAGRIDHRDRLGRDARHRRGDEVADRLRLARRRACRAPSSP